MLTGRDLDKLRKRARIVAGRLADRDTPFIRNCWYVAARSSEVGREIFERVLLGTSVILYRDLAGAVVALANRCCHRSFPLSEGRLVGDRVKCGYHGLEFDSSGLCVAVPGQAEVRGRFGVACYPVVERGPFVWIWLGEAEKADPALIPAPEWLGHPDWDMGLGYMKVEGSYVGLHENLLDLSHLSFLHENTFGTPEYAAAPCEMVIEAARIEVWREVECFLPAVYAKPLGWEGMRAVRRSGSQFVSPALHVNTGIMRNLELAEESQVPLPTIKVAQIITPETAETTHYYFALCRNFVRGNTQVDAAMVKGFETVFGEDQFALERITEMQLAEDPALFSEIDIATDAAGLEMRRRLKAMAEAEADKAE